MLPDASLVRVDPSILLGLGPRDLKALVADLVVPVTSALVAHESRETAVSLYAHISSSLCLGVSSSGALSIELDGTHQKFRFRLPLMSILCLPPSKSSLIRVVISL